MTIKRETLHKFKNRVKKPDYQPSKEDVNTLLYGCFELLDQIDGGNTAMNRGRQVRMGLDDLRKVLHEVLGNVPADLEPAVVDPTELIRDVQKAVLISELIDQMLAEKGPQWRQEWDWYRLRVAEEFDE